MIGTGPIAFLPDITTSRERFQLTQRIAYLMRRLAPVEILSPAITEDQLVKQVLERQFRLTLLPIKQYLEWSRIEGAYGLTRTSGPTVIGYFTQPLGTDVLAQIKSTNRLIILDFQRLRYTDILLIIRSLLVDNQRYGLTPLFSESKIYCDAWHGRERIGEKLDLLMSITEIKETNHWFEQRSRLRLGLLGLWSLVYDEGPGRIEFGQSAAALLPKAYVQVSASHEVVAIRVCYTHPMWGSREVIEQIQSEHNPLNSAFSLARQSCDLFRVHNIVENHDVEITLLYFSSHPSESNHSSLRSVWVEPLTAAIVNELPFEMPSAKNPKLVYFPKAEMVANNLGAHPSQFVDLQHQLEIKDRAISLASKKLRELTHENQELNDRLHELKLGGVGSVYHLSLPGHEELTESLRVRLEEMKDGKEKEVALISLQAVIEMNKPLKKKGAA